MKDQAAVSGCMLSGRNRYRNRLFDPDTDSDPDTVLLP